MIVYDLINELDSFTFMKECHRKLNDSFVKYNGQWRYCTVDHPDSVEAADVLLKGHNFVYLDGGTSLNSVEEIDTEPEWPECGWYWIDNQSTEIKYKKESFWKAGLTSDLIDINIYGKPTSILTKLSVLQQTDKEPEYPNISECKGLLLSTKNTVIPISKELLVTAHPYINSPVLTYKNTTVGKIDDDIVTVFLDEEDCIDIAELLDHLEISYVMG